MPIQKKVTVDRNALHDWTLTIQFKEYVDNVYMCTVVTLETRIAS